MSAYELTDEGLKQAIVYLMRRYPRVDDRRSNAWRALEGEAEDRGMSSFVSTTRAGVMRERREAAKCEAVRASKAAGKTRLIDLD